MTSQGSGSTYRASRYERTLGWSSKFNYQQLTTIDILGSLSYVNVHLGSVFDEFVADLLKGGQYQSQSEVLREGRRLLKGGVENPKNFRC
jgi:hypothetical protein